MTIVSRSVESIKIVLLNHLPNVDNHVYFIVLSSQLALNSAGGSIFHYVYGTGIWVVYGLFYCKVFGVVFAELPTDAIMSVQRW